MNVYDGDLSGSEADGINSRGEPINIEIDDPSYEEDDGNGGDE